jgi:uncharacterized DUF497 family protein
MIDDDFEWNDDKALSNQTAHGVKFEAARGVFRDAFALDWLDERENYGEVPYVTIGMAAGRLIYVAYTMRDQRIRIISARGAEPHERRTYYEANA